MSILALVLVVGVVSVFAAARAEHALASAFWGLATLLFFVPAGALLALVVADHELLFSGLVSLVVLSGVATGAGLLFLANRLRQTRAAPLTAIGQLTLVHHLVVFVILGGGLMLSGNGDAAELAALLGGLAVPCAIGGFVGWRLAFSARASGSTMTA